MSAIIEKHICVCKKCKLNSRDSKFVVAGKKTEFILENFKKRIVNQYIVDDCLLRTKLREEKCDFLFIIKEGKIAYLIECKGSDVLKAIDQLNSTLDILKDDLLEYTVKARIIPTKTYAPNLVTSSYKKLRERLNKNLETKNRVCTEKI